MIKVVSDRGRIDIEMGGNLGDIKSEFVHLCIELAKKIGKELENCGLPEGRGSKYTLATMLTSFVAKEADMLGPAALIMNGDKIAEFCKKTEGYIDDAINEFSSDTVEELDIDKLADVLGKIFGVKAKTEAGEAEPAEPAPEETAKEGVDHE